MFDKRVFFRNAFGYYCPDCSRYMKKPTAWAHRLFDEKYHVYKSYIQCEDCGRTTPAYENIDKAEENWNHQFILVEDSLIMGEHKEDC